MSIRKFNSYIKEGFNLYTLKSRVDYMKDLYVKIVGMGDEIFKVLSIDVNDIHDGSLVVVSEETGNEEVISHDDISSTIVGREYDKHKSSQDARLHAARMKGEYGTPLSRIKRFRR